MKVPLIFDRTGRAPKFIIEHVAGGWRTRNQYTGLTVTHGADKPGLAAMGAATKKLRSPHSIIRR